MDRVETGARAGRPTADDAPLVRGHWSDVGAAWVEDEPQRLWRRHADLVAGELARRWISPGRRALLKTDLFDEGVGRGSYPDIAPLAERVVGIDVARPVVRAATARYPAIEGRVSDIRDLPFPDASFDAVFSPSTLDHFAEVGDIRTALIELRRVTAPGGRLVITLDNPWNPLVGLRQALPGQWLRRIGLVPYFCGATVGPRRLARMLTETGFRVREVSSTIHCPRVVAVALGEVIERWTSGAEGRTAAAYLKALRGFEAMRRLPTAPFTGHFSAIAADAV